MRYPRVWFVFLPFASLLLALVLSVRSRAGEPRWLTATPESEGFDKAKLDAARDVLAARNTTGFLVIRQNRIVYEWYAADSGPDKPHYTASMAKALVGGMSLMLALNDGRIAVDDAGLEVYPGVERRSPEIEDHHPRIWRRIPPASKTPSRTKFRTWSCPAGRAVSGAKSPTRLRPRFTTRR